MRLLCLSFLLAVSYPTLAQKSKYLGYYSRTDVYFRQTDTADQELHLEKDSFTLTTVKCFNGIRKEEKSHGVWKVDSKNINLYFDNKQQYKGRVAWDYDAPEPFERKLVPMIVLDNSTYFFWFIPGGHTLKLKQ